jgi:hypothetical protein
MYNKNSYQNIKKILNNKTLRIMKNIHFIYFLNFVRTDDIDYCNTYFLETENINIKIIIK